MRVCKLCAACMLGGIGNLIIWTIVAVLLMLGGCAELSAVKKGIADHGAQGAQDVRETAEWTLCRAITVGEWVRAYGNDPGKAAGWRALCATPINATPAEQ
jgi:hypothetical protein